jgi:hypothetical protein
MGSQEQVRPRGAEGEFRKGEELRVQRYIREDFLEKMALEASQRILKKRKFSDKRHNWRVE